MIGHGARFDKPRNESTSGAGIDEPLGRKWRDVGVRGVGRVPKDLFEMRVCGKRTVGSVHVRRRKRTDEHPFVDRLEQPRERVCTGLRSNGTRCFRYGTNGTPSRKRRQESES